MNWYLKVLRQYAVFTGRARRKEYWFFILFNFIFAILLNLLDQFAGTYSAKASAGLFGGIYTLFILCPSLAVLARRLHDTGRSEKWIIWGMLLPLVVTSICSMIASEFEFHLNALVSSTILIITMLNWVVITVVSLILLVFACLPSQAGTNMYGPNPISA